MKNSRLLTILFFFSVKSILAQNLASSIYDISYLPKEMSQVERFIEKLCSTILVYNYSSTSFELRGKDFIEIQLPLKEDFSITVKEHNSTQLAKGFALTYEYFFPYVQMYPTAEINDATFSIPHLLETATEYYQLSEYEILPEIVKMRTDFRTLKEYFAAQIDFFKQIATDFRVDPAIFNEFEKLAEKENQTIREFDKLLVDTLLENIDSETNNNFLADFYEKEILSRYTNAKSMQMIDYIFSRENVLEVIKDEVLQPKLTLYFNERGLFNLPTKLVSSPYAESNSFPIDTIEVSIDLYNQRMNICFTSQKAIHLELKKAFLNDSKVKKKGVEASRMSIEISEQKTRLFIEDFNYKKNTYYLNIK